MALVAAIATCVFLLPEDGGSGASRNFEILPATTSVPLALSLPESHGKLPVAGPGLKPILLAPFAERFLTHGWRPKFILADVVASAAALHAPKPLLVGTVELRI